ncbi:MAG: hypothetical protein JSS70_17075 [Bacteroidetes bacterium]|nr:hypothetical protein [Bacteroidota bacterium]
MKAKTKKKAVSSKKQQKKKIIIASFAVGAAGILGYFGWQYLKKKKAAKNGADLDEMLKAATTATSAYEPGIINTQPKTTTTGRSTYTIPKSAEDKNAFPLKKGSKGSNVQLLQEALLAKYGKSILPKYGADGDFGSETVNALKKAGLSATINESTFNVLTQGKKADKSTIGDDLYNATAAKNYNKVLSLLKQMQSTDDYSAANEVFKTNRINGVRQTVVNGLLNTFTSDAQKQQIKFEFLRMGLQFDGNKWSLSGFDGKPIVTAEATTVWINAVDGVKVPAKMVLGNEVTRRLDYTLFENNGKYFLVNTKSVNYLN